MLGIGLVGLLLIIANIIVTYRGLKSDSFYEKYKFEVEKVLLYKDYKRIVTGGFLHVSWLHLFFNMLSLFFFSGSIESALGPWQFLLIYFGGLIGGNLFALYVHRHHPDYSSIGASGATCGILFAAVALFPGMGIMLFPLPISVPAWLYGLLFVGISVYGIRSGRDNIGYEAHLGGALVGMITAILLKPSVVPHNYFAILAVAVPTIAFIYIIARKPHLLMINNLFYDTHKNYRSIDHKYNAERFNRQQEVDRILDKISSRGMKSLTKKERETLKEYSKKIES
jgi:membrane associated rhomboid family serine protease